MKVDYLRLCSRASGNPAFIWFCDFPSIAGRLLRDYLGEPLHHAFMKANTFPPARGGGRRLAKPLVGRKKTVAQKMHRRKPQRPQLKKCSSKPVSSQAVCSKKICFGGLFQFCSRALGPPRLAAGAGDRQSETLTNIYNLAPSGCFSKRFPLLTPAFSNPQAPACPFIRKDLFRLRACLRPLGRFRKSITTNPLLPDSGWDEWW